jgi:AraC-like DNA-binding protein
MSKSPYAQDAEIGTGESESPGSAVNYSQLFERLNQAISLAQAAVITSLPRGGLQLTHAAHAGDSLIRSYLKEYSTHDRPAWEAIMRRQPVSAEQCWPHGRYETSPYYTGFLRGNGLRYAIAAPLKAPVIDGYAGAIEVFRGDEQGPFNQDDLSALSDFAADLDEQIARDRETRRGDADSREIPLSHHTRTRQFVFDGKLKVCVGESEFNELDQSLRNNVLDLARQRFGQVNGKQITTDRVSLPDATGDLWNFRVVTHSSYSALGEGPFVFFCIQPDCADWALIRADDFDADQELARLVPALKFMQNEFHRGPTLQEIAKTVHLSPFHFHRRFTELLGITPKHFLLDCQIEQAKEQLIAREKELSEIATACGFAHQSHFTSRFKQATGLTPTRWRRLANEARR